MDRGRVAADAEVPQQQRQARRRLAAAEHHRVERHFIVQQALRVELAVWRAVVVQAKRSANSIPIMPVPTAQPQRRRVCSEGRMPASRIASSAAASAKRCDRLANLSSLRSATAAASSKPLTSAAMRTGKPLASNRVMAAMRLRPSSSVLQVVGRVVARRGHQPQSRNRDAPLAPSSLRCPCASISSTTHRDALSAHDVRWS